MAKISRINIAITGDEKGLKAATDAATKDLARLNAAASRSQSQMKRLSTQTVTAAESLNRLGVQSRGLGAVAGVAALGGLGAMGLGLGAAGLGLAAGGFAIDAVQSLPDVRKRASQALEDSQRDQRRRIEEMGFSQLIAQQIAARAPTPSVAGSIGIGEAFSQGLASQGGSIAEVMINEWPKVIATEIGALLGGATMDEANKLGLSQVTSGDVMQDLNRSMGLMNQLPEFGLQILRWISK